MSAPLSPVDYCNLAFDLLRQKDKVVNFETPVSESEALASRWFDQTRRSVLSSFLWNFAKTRTTLSLNAVEPAFGYANRYQLPVNYLGLVFVGEDIDEDYEEDYSVEGNFILIDYNDADHFRDICL